MRTYGRITNQNSSRTWVVVQTDENGYNDAVYITTLIQVLKLNLGESPFWSNHGIPAQPALIQQVFPDYYVTVTQQQFARYFASLIMAKRNVRVGGRPVPTYDISIVTNLGSKVSLQVPT